LAGRLAQIRTTPRIVALDHRARVYGLRRALELKLHAYVARTDGPQDVVLAVSAALNNMCWYSASVRPLLDFASGEYRIRETDGPGLQRLSPREFEVLGRIAHGDTSTDCARRLGIAPSTVDNHRANIMRKLGANSAADLVRIGFEEGLCGG
jgi:DNA-binding NarL/FixJ family response regulator